jgi:hypothetical protein
MNADGSDKRLIFNGGNGVQPLHGRPVSWCQDCLATGAYHPLEEQAA